MATSFGTSGAAFDVAYRQVPWRPGASMVVLLIGLFGVTIGVLGDTLILAVIMLGVAALGGFWLLRSWRATQVARRLETRRRRPGR